MLFLTEDAIIVCKHELGQSEKVPTQDWVTVAQRRVLVEVDPEGKTIKGCPNIGVGIKPCTTTLRVQEGYSDWIRVEGKRVCLDTVTGLTDGTPPGTVKYKVNDAGQHFVEEV
jgi:hypothetical protein